MSFTVKASPVKLTWANFKPVKKAPDADKDAYTASTYKIVKAPFTKTPGGNTKLGDLDIVVVADKNSSWVLTKPRTAKESQELLEHEQGHHDLTFLVARTLALDLEALSTTSEAELEKQMQEAIARHNSALGTLQIDYDRETDHSQNVPGQKRWNSDIAKALNDPKATQVGARSL